MAVNNVFDSDIFSLQSLTDAINKLPFKPSRIGSMGLFGTRGVTTLTVLIEENADKLALLSTKHRGGPSNVGQGEKRTVRSFAIPHIPLEDAILAEQVQNIRAFGTENQLQSVSQVVNDRLEVMRQSHEVTLEYHRIGALQGKIYDADGVTLLFNLFTEFGVSEQEVDFDLGDSTTDCRLKCLAVKRAVETALGAAPYDHIHAFVGKTWFDAFIGHTSVKEAYDRFQEGQFLRNDPRKGFEFAGIVFEEYPGTVSGVDFFPAAQARFFPVGVPNMYLTYFAPADFMETVNTVGLPIYAKKEMMSLDRGVTLHTQQNPLCVCTRPKALIKGLYSASGS